VTALIGPNGADKATLFGLVGRRRDTGRITVDGTDVATASSRDLATVRPVLRQGDTSPRG
jgi:ABC-type enterochelin transport system ATPase subunit